MNNFGCWLYIALSWVIVDWIIAGDVLIKWVGRHGNPAMVFVFMATPAVIYWIIHQHPDAWRKLSTYKGIFICILAAIPAIPLVRYIRIIVDNPKVVTNVPWFVALLFIAVMLIIIAAKVVLCVYWWRKLQHRNGMMDLTDK